MDDCEWVSYVVASSDSNEGYALTATYRVYADGRVTGLRFDLETFGDINFGADRAKKFLKKIRRAEKLHAEKFGIAE